MQSGSFQTQAWLSYVAERSRMDLKGSGLARMYSHPTGNDIDPPPSKSSPNRVPPAPAFVNEQQLIFGHNFNHPIAGMKEWPPSLLQLSFGHSFNQTVAGVALPPGLEVSRVTPCRLRCCFFAFFCQVWRPLVCVYSIARDCSCKHHPGRAW